MKYIALFLLLILPLSCSDDSVSITGIYGYSNIATMKNATKVEVALLHDTFNDRDFDKTHKRDITEKTVRKILSNAASQHMTEILLAKKSYREGSKACIPIWGARVIFSKKFSKTSIDFCFRCKILRINGLFTTVMSADANFDNASNDLLKIFQQAFTEENEIQEMEVR